MGISRLPKPGSDFVTKNTISSFESKLKRITRIGSLQNLQNNIPAIVRVVKKYEKHIKKGGFSSWYRLFCLKEIKKLDKSLTRDDIREIKQILNHLGK